MTKVRLGTLARLGKKPYAGVGPITGCDLAALESLVQPFAQDPFYRLRPPFSPEAARLSLELSDMAYTLELDAWEQAGWNDFSILIDDTLQSGLTRWESGESLQNFVSRFKLMRAKAALNERNPVSQVMGALRQREKSDTVKAVCMMHALPGERWLLAIGFMGTGKRFYDWISNLRFTPEEGFHRGFQQLCESFEINVDSIVFPTVAKVLGVERLTLGQVLADMRSLSSRFRLWMTGHSQGSAVMQVFAHRLLRDWGVLAQNMVGYGFASPTVATGRFVYDPSAYPLFHILNTDDLVPRMGALLHLGLCMEFPADDAFAQKAYGEPTLEEEALMRRLQPFLQDMVDTPSCMEHLVALTQCVVEEKGADGMTELMTSWWAIPAVDRMLWRAGDKAMDWVERFLTATHEAYLVLTGHEMNEVHLYALRERLRPVVQESSVRPFVTALVNRLVPPHAIGHREDSGAYGHIVRDHLSDLRPFIWQKVSAGLPVKRYAEREAWADGPLFAQGIRRSRPRKAVAQSKMRLSHHNRRDTRLAQP